MVALPPLTKASWCLAGFGWVAGHGQTAMEGERQDLRAWVAKGDLSTPPYAWRAKLLVLRKGDTEHF